MTGTRSLWVVVAVAMGAMIGLVQPVAAASFTWEQNAGLFFPGADATTTGTLRAGQFFGADDPPVADHGGLEFSGQQTAPPAPLDTYSLIQWGCEPDTNNDPGVTNCVNGGGLANVFQIAQGGIPLAVGRSGLLLDTYTSGSIQTQGGPINSLTGNIVRIARLNHLNGVIDNESNALKAVSIKANLVISGANPSFTSANTVDITFLETNNVPAGVPSTPADCVAAGLLNPLGSVCDDIFTFVGDFQNVPFTSNGQQFFLQFGLQPPPECTLDQTIGTLQIFNCPGPHKIGIDFPNGIAYASEGFDNAIEVTMFVTEQPVGGDGCTPGYWKQRHHFGSYTPPYYANQLMSNAFPELVDELTDTEENRSLVQTLSQGGGGRTALLRHFVAAVLNAANPNVVSQYENIQQIIDAVEAVLNNQQATLGGQFFNSIESLKDALEDANEGGCPLGRAPGSGNPPA